MWSAPQEMSKIGLYMVDADAQKAAMALARMAVLHPLNFRLYPETAWGCAGIDRGGNAGSITGARSTAESTLGADLGARGANSSTKRKDRRDPATR
jgi:hypothetical protein